MAKVTSKYQVTVPRKIAEQYNIRPGDDIDWVPAGDAIRVMSSRKKRRASGEGIASPFVRSGDRTSPPAATGASPETCGFKRLEKRGSLRSWPLSLTPTSSSTGSTAVLPKSRKLQPRFSGAGYSKIQCGCRIEAIVEFVAAVTRPIRGHIILKQADALREAEEFLKQFTVLYPNEAILREAVRGCAAYQLNWFDAHIWAYAEHYGLAEILSEDFQHDRLYGTVRAVNPFSPERFIG